MKKKCFNLSCLQDKKIFLIMRMTILILLVSLLQVSANSSVASSKVDSEQQQSKSISGTVTDQDGNTLPGVSVFVKGTTIGTITDIDGNYKLDVPNDASTLVFSTIGMTTVEESIAGKNEINVIMESAIFGIDEVVVTALGIKRDEKTLTYAQQTVSGEDLLKARDINFVNSISGKISGVEIKKSSSGAGGSTKVILRGNKSLSGSSEPLYVIDGIPMANNKGGQPGMWGGIDGGDGISQINSEDIESLTVLKGSNAAALYGSQGANGVIIITTKSGKKGKARVEISSGVTFESIIKTPDLQFDYGSVDGAKESWSTSKGDYNNSFVDDFFKTGLNLLNSITISGGGDKTTAYFSYANITSNGVIPENKYQKNNVTFKQSTKLFNDKMNISSNVMLTDEVTNNRNPAGYYINPLTGLYFFPRNLDFNSYKENYEVFNEGRNMYLQNWFVEDHHQSNPYWIINRQPKEDKVKRAITNISLDYQIANNLKLQLRGSYDYAIKSYEMKHYAGSNGTNVHANGAWDYSKSTDELIYTDAILTYNKKFGDISLDAIVGTSYQKSTYGVGVRVATGTTGLKFANEFNFQNIEDNVMVNSTYGSKKIKQAVFGNVQLGYKEMLFLDISGRNDWASTLVGTGNDSYFYPAFGLTALISEMVELPDFISFGKIRTSYTTVANEVPFNMVHPNHTITFAGVEINTTKPFTNLKPEMLRSLEFGTDWRFFNGRLGFDFTYYNINSQDQFINLPAPSGSGYTRYFVNAGEIVNSGIEISVNATPVKSGDFSWSTAFNYSNNKNEIVELHEDLGDAMNISDSEGYQLIIKKGGSFGDLYVHKFLRDEQGRIMLDENGAIQKTAEKEFIGNSNPDWSLGWNNNINYKDLSFGFLINSKFGGKVISQTEAMLDGYGVSQRTADARNAGGVTIDAVMPDGTAVTKMGAETYYRATGMRNGIKEPYTYDRTNIRLAEVSVTYNLNLQESNLPIDKLTFSLVGQNLLFFYKEAPFDPELAMNTTNAFQSLDNFNLPSTRTYGFNIRITF